MILRTFLLADAVDVGPGGKAFIHGGGVTRIFAEDVPSTHAMLGVFAIIEGEIGESGDSKHILEIRILGPDDEPLPARVEAPMQLGEQTDAELPLSVSLAIGFAGVRFPTHGLYHIQIRVDERELGRRPLLVRKPL